MKARVKTKVVIEASAADVFTYLVDTRLHYLWNPHIQKISPLKRLKEGATYSTDSLILGVRTRAKNTVSVFVEGTEFAVHNKTGMLQYSVHYSLVEKGAAVELTCTLSVSAEGRAFAFAKPMLEHLARRELRIDLEAFKQAVEQKLT